MTGCRRDDGCAEQARERLMKLWVLSDLHLTTFERTLHTLPEVIPSIPEADLAVIAGDVGDGIETSAVWLAEHVRPHMPVLWILGNHEFYGGWFKTSRDLARRRAAELGLTLLDDEVAVIGGVRFVGSTLWTSYDLYANGDEAIRREHMFYARHYLADHRHIDLEAGKMDRFLPAHAREQYLESRAWLERVLSERFIGDTVVVTHHAPSTKSVAPLYRGDPLTPAFVSNLDELIVKHQPRYWIHGHTHSSFDYRIGQCRVICNPRGYGRENFRSFRRDLVLVAG
jgi:Icc-related predicted phosphoesterase